ncbi:disintegrin and metalloproteinase domain-containing protein 19-like isoform X1 [Eriocheir sinensis]|uniref:disintegrin and metalloproteinase domain-containing protein 19-like isoform X1 n=1 Tax=Eriocheir sinensis TaxID=95602 RepID=UPI0021C5E220|nr:disintegrin and metalloproteinase domain-containing protein 19-like isoform X1 [Eriocheir sinensis]
MLLLHNTVVCATTLLLCFNFSSTAEQALQPNTKVQASLEGETRLPQQGGPAGAAAAVHLTATTQEPPIHRLAAGDSSRQNKGRDQPSTSEESENKVPPEASDNTRQGTTGMNDGRARAAGEGRKQEKVTQGVRDNLDTQEWFTETLNVTITPKVTWTRRRDPHGPPPPTQEKDSSEKRGKRDEDAEEHILLTVTFNKDGQALILDLHPNRDLLTAAYTESSGGVAGGNDTLPRESKAPPCEYQGVVRGMAKTWAALSVCGGLRGVVSVTLEEGQQVDLMVEPSPGSTSPRGPHTVLSAALLRMQDGVCGVKDSGSPAETEEEAEDAHPTAERSTNASSSPGRRARRWAQLMGGPMWYQGDTRFVELVLVADHSFFVSHGDQTRSRCKAIVNIVNAVYRPLGVVVVLSHLEVWEHGDKIPVTENYSQNLNLFKTYRKKMLEEEPDYNNDNTMLLTTVDFNSNTVGFAVVSGMCGIALSTGVVQDKPQQHVGVTAFTLAHEMGHNFGMKHDEEQEDSCHCRSCIMSGQGSYKYKPHTSWSSCSRKVIEGSLNSVTYQCLRNVPERMFPISSCGDGVVDAGEQCDCGPAEFCDNPCCVAKTCKFAVNASCASGPCCDIKTCQPKSAGIVCRAAFTECDLPEFCSGDSQFCPEDVNKRDGAPCNNGQGHCYEAKCGSHQDLCHRVWGQSARVADPVCYSELNKRGGSNGNCGFKGEGKTDLLPCADGDERCGSLQCLVEPGTEPKRLGAAYNYGTYTPRTFPRASCSYIVSSDTLRPSYWLTPDGAQCGKNMMCLKQKCVRMPEPAGDCRGGCSDRGVCNSRNHCHCDPGFAPPDCSKEGSGGSIDSNKIGRDRYKDPLWETIFIMSLILLGIAIAIFCLWSHIRRWWETGGRGKICPCCARCLDICCCSLMSLITDRLFVKKNKEDVSKEAQDEYERDRMICQVDLDIKDQQPKTKSWGVASEMLVTEVTTTTPKNSPDYRRKILLPSNHSDCHSKTVEIPNRPTYMQSVSVDSGCVSDGDDTTVKDPFGSQMSMKSLLNLFKNFGSRSPSSAPEEENAPPKTYERQRSMPLSRFVVDPLAGSRRSRQGTPPPNHLKSEWRRSISMDTKTNPSDCPGGKPFPPQPPTGKLSKGISSLTQTCRSTEQNMATTRDGRSDDNGQGTPIPEEQKSLRPAPARPPPAAPSTTPSPTSKVRKVLMPPSKKDLTSVSRKTQSSSESSPPSNSSSKTTQENIKGPPKRPVLPPGKRSPKHSGVTPCGSSAQRADGGLHRPSPAGGRVKDLAKKLEKQ